MQADHIKIGNSAGFAKHMKEAELLAKLPITHAILGSFTVEPRDGNSGEVYGENDRGGRLNCLGMPNPGLTPENLELPAMVQTLQNAEKHVSVSIAGFCPDDYANAAHKVCGMGADEAEINLGCPNADHAIFSFDLKEMRIALNKIGMQTPSNFPLSLKLSPYSNPEELKNVAKLLNELSGYGYWQDRPLRVVCSNTFPNAYAFKPGTLEPLLSGSGYGGYSGPGYKAIALGQVKQFRELLKPHIGITGVGDIQNAQDVKEFYAAGADRVQVGNAFMAHEDGRIFGEILAGLNG